MENLKPCPFCGGINLKDSHRKHGYIETDLQGNQMKSEKSYTFAIGCNNCGFILNAHTFNGTAKGRTFSAATLEEVIKMWNTRGC